MHAIIETGGKQYKVAEGDVLFIEKLPQQAGDEIKFDKVLAVLGDEPKFGAPVVEGASVDASVVKNGKGKKVVIFKYKPKKGYRLRQGHRQGSRIQAFTIEGHSGWADSGEDILCAAITSAVRLTECAVNDVLGLEAQVKVNEQDASLTLKLPRNLEGEADQVCQTLLAALMVYFVQLQEEYPQHINVMEV